MASDQTSSGQNDSLRLFLVIWYHIMAATVGSNPIFRPIAEGETTHFNPSHFDISKLEEPFFGENPCYLMMN
jgi:hypothetical protein